MDNKMSTKIAIIGSFIAIVILIVAQVLAGLIASGFSLVKLPEGICNIIAGVLYDKDGYVEYNKACDINTAENEMAEVYKHHLQESILGTQVWIPMLSDGKYSGAIMFDKKDTNPYTVPDKYLLAEMVNALTAYINKLNAEDANKAKSNFLSTMSHEIRTPMNAIMGMTEVALREDMSDSIRKCLKTVQSSAVGLLALINDILDFSKVEAGKIDIVSEKYQVLSLVNDMYEIIKARNNNKLELILNVDEKTPSVLYGDVVRLKQVMINFCTNAIKYTDKGSVTVDISMDKIENETGVLLFSVKDTGIGIKQEDLSKLFKNYGQVDQKVNHHKEGTGLGLAISKQLIDLMDGRVSVESEYGKGSTFSFRVPQKIIDKAPAGKLEDFKYENDNEKEQTLSFTAEEAKILIVDDTKINLMVANALFKPIKMQIEVANDGYEAIAKTKEQKYDLIFMDYFMPGMDGAETTKQIRASVDNPNKEVPIIALTADAMSGVREKLLEQGMNDFLSKPIEIKHAYQALYEWLPKEKIKES